jgi:hypothetical protein
MADREQPYDPYIPSSGAGGQAGAGGQNGNVRTAALQAVRQYPRSPRVVACIGRRCSLAARTRSWWQTAI